METNELSRNAMGGTELMLKGLYEHVDNDLLNEFQIIPSRVREIDENKKTILYLHDLAGDPEVQHLKDGGWQKFDKLVFVSYWQQQMYQAYLGVPFDAGVVLHNAIVPIGYRAPVQGRIRMVYTSTPHRGLDILYPVFDKLSQEYDNLELDVFSSFALYGWEERDAPYRELFDKLKEHPNINYHGTQSNDRVREAVSQAHIFAYPSTWQETSCICLIEAMSAGCLCVHSSLAALPETAMNLTQMYPFTEDKNKHANIFYNQLKYALDNWGRNDVNLRNNLSSISAITDSVYGWQSRKIQWTTLLTSLV